MNKYLFYISMAGVLSLQLPAAAQNNLDSLSAPRITGVAPSDAFIGLSRMSDGEIIPVLTQKRTSRFTCRAATTDLLGRRYICRMS